MDIFGVLVHGPDFIHINGFPVFTDAFLFEKKPIGRIPVLFRFFDFFCNKPGKVFDFF